MSNRTMANRAFYSTRDRKVIDVKVAIGATGAPTLTANPFVKSVTRDAAGKYTIVFGNALGLDTYNKLAGVSAVFDTSGAAGAAPAAPVVCVIDNQIADKTKAFVQVMCVDLETPAATDPANGEVMYLTFAFGDSGVL